MGPLRVGLAFLPATIVMGAMSLRYAARVQQWIGAYRTLLVSLALLTAGLLVFTRVPVGGSYLVDVAPAMVLTGLGAGLGFPALTGMAMSAATPSDSGVASGLFNTTVQVGGAIGLAVLSSLADSRTHHLRSAGTDAVTALVGGYHLAFALAAGAALLAGVTAAVLLRPATAIDEDASPAGAALVGASE